MRAVRTPQCSIFDAFAEHAIGQELSAISQWLDEHPELCEWVSVDLRQAGIKETGREGLPAESVLRCALLKQYRQLSYVELAFHLLDSASFQAFARLPGGWRPKKSALHHTISSISACTWERINHALLACAQLEKVERAQQVCLDSTVTESDIHPPSDSSLLRDAMRVMVRLLKDAEALPGAPALDWVNHERRARKRARAIDYTRGVDKKLPLYRDLVKVTRATLGYLAEAEQRLSQAGSVTGVAFSAWWAQVLHYRPLVERVIAQTERRVFDGEAVPASEKLLSLFETHTDIIKKRDRDIQYGHKLNLTSGKSGMILDVVVERGNPADSERFLPMLDRHIAHFASPPRQMAADGGYASAANLAHAKARGVEDMAFHKKCHLQVEDMVRSRWVYRKLRNFRASIEADISCLKRAYGLGRCLWKGWRHFQSYVWSSVVAYNLALFARLRPT